MAKPSKRRILADNARKRSKAATDSRLVAGDKAATRRATSGAALSKSTTLGAWRGGVEAGEAPELSSRAVISPPMKAKPRPVEASRHRRKAARPRPKAKCSCKYACHRLPALTAAIAAGSYSRPAARRRDEWHIASNMLRPSAEAE